METTAKPLFVPLRREHFLAFENGEKRAEWRRHGPRFNAGTCYAGRMMVLSLGYSGRRLLARITNFSLELAKGPAAEIYGCDVECAVIHVELIQ